MTRRLDSGSPVPPNRSQVPGVTLVSGNTGSESHRWKQTRDGSTPSDGTGSGLTTVFTDPEERNRYVSSVPSLVSRDKFSELSPPRHQSPDVSSRLSSR